MSDFVETKNDIKLCLWDEYSTEEMLRILQKPSGDKVLWQNNSIIGKNLKKSRENAKDEQRPRPLPTR